MAVHTILEAKPDDANAMHTLDTLMTSFPQQQAPFDPAGIGLQPLNVPLVTGAF